MTPSETVLYSFRGKSDGAGPGGALIADRSGALYGTTVTGGRRPCNGLRSGCGVVFKLTPSGTTYVQSVLYAFAGGQDGSQPVAGLVADAAGALYGTTSFGGSASFCPNIPQGTGCGTVFRLKPLGSGYVEDVLYRFHGGEDGAYPIGNLIIDRSGTLFGTTWLGGTSSCRQLHLTGCGTIFKLAPNGSTYTKTTLYSFAGGPNDGARPAAALLPGTGGKLYGTTEFGAGKGTVFALTPAGSGYVETTLFTFRTADQGANPIGALVADASGALYGTTRSGRKAPGCTVASRTVGCGTVFRLAPSPSGYTETVLHQFVGGSDGFAPVAGVTLGKKGRLYGTTFAGGSGGAGTVYELAPSGSEYSETVLIGFADNFRANGGAFPNGGLIIDRTGSLYGTTGGGGARCVDLGGCGTVFRVKPR